MNINYGELLDVTIRAILSLVTLFFITKLIGKKQVSELSLFDYVIGISIGNFFLLKLSIINTQPSNLIIFSIILFTFLYL